MPFGSPRGADSGALQRRSLGLRTGADSRALAEHGRCLLHVYQMHVSDHEE